ncbi:MAG TPA: hypothetical protein VFA10_12940 [Ktedonobacteraceae bacterium]|nr:hypothetical protein [Ktedonobacteraceae bacterium]
MKPQSPDTSLDAELVLIRMIRAAPVSRRFAFVQAWTASMIEAGRCYIQQLYPHASADEIQWLYLERQYGHTLADQLRHFCSTHHIQPTPTPDMYAAIVPFVRALERLALPYALFGSLASSLYGLQRATQQIDLLADLRQEHLPALCQVLEGSSILHYQEQDSSLEHLSSFTFVHLQSLLKIVVTPAEQLIGEQSLTQQVRRLVLVEENEPIAVLAPETLIVSLLNAFRRSEERADDLWYDLLGILKVQRTNLDMLLLEQQAALGDVSALLARALLDAGLRTESRSLNKQQMPSRFRQRRQKSTLKKVV